MCDDRIGLERKRKMTLKMSMSENEDDEQIGKVKKKFH